MDVIRQDMNIQFRTSIKKSKKRELWQLKDQDHAIYSLHGLHELIESAITHLGCNILDRSKIYELVFGTNEFPGFQFKLERNKLGPDYIDFKVCENRINDSKPIVWLPKILFSYFNDYPEVLFISIEESKLNEIVFLQRI